MVTPRRRRHPEVAAVAVPPERLEHLRVAAHRVEPLRAEEPFGVRLQPRVVVPLLGVERLAP